MQKEATAWHNQAWPQIWALLKCSEIGLSSSEVKKRQAKYGGNVLAKAEKSSVLTLFLNQFKSALVYVLLVAGFISVLFRSHVDAGVIFAAVILNVVIGFFQEYKANQALTKLNAVVKSECIVSRDGRQFLVETKDLVPGDLIILRPGSRVPADARILVASALEVNEAPLTGESWPVKKQTKVLPVGTVLAERSNMLFMGTLVVEGTSQALVVATGQDTEIGKIASLLQSTPDDATPLQKKINALAQSITKIILVIALFIFIMGMFYGYDWPQMFTLSVAWAVSAIPEGLMIGVSMILTVGMQRILKHNGLVRRLLSAETLGATNVICTDKTGTLTEGEMRVTYLVMGKDRYDLNAVNLKDLPRNLAMDKMQVIAALCNDGIVQNPQAKKKDWEIIASPTEKALLLFGARQSQYAHWQQKYRRQGELPFDSSRKYMLTRHTWDREHDIILLKGAGEVVLPACSGYEVEEEIRDWTDNEQDKLKKMSVELSNDGLRVLAAAWRLIPKKDLDLADNKILTDFTFVGYWGLSDPLRTTIKESLQATKNAGIETIIITGDNKHIAAKIASDSGLASDKASVLTGQELMRMDDAALQAQIKNIKIFARVSPADKLRIVKAWQATGAVVAMTGDGVNDAPALKAADIGVVVNTASDIAKETADLVLLDNNFHTIVMAIKEGRVIFANIKKVILYLLSDSFAEMLIITSAIMFGLPLPLVTAQILWINLVSDGLPSLALTMEPEEAEVMDKPPRRSVGLFDSQDKVLFGVISVVTSLCSLGLFWYYLRATGNVILAQTVTFTFFGLTTLFYVYSIKNLQRSIFHSHSFRNYYLNYAVLIGIGLQLLAVYHPFFNQYIHTMPLHISHWSVILILLFMIVAVTELSKMIFNFFAKNK